VHNAAQDIVAVATVVVVAAAVRRIRQGAYAVDAVPPINARSRHRKLALYV
jgi:hypothetical protein